jgi:hypothetical protein
MGSSEGPPTAGFGYDVLCSCCYHSCLRMVASSLVWKEQRAQSVPNHRQYYSGAMAERHSVGLYDRSHEGSIHHDNPDYVSWRHFYVHDSKPLQKFAV